MNENLIGSQIARYRKEAGLTQEELGRAVGVSTQAVSRWECGGTPDVLLLPAIADRLHVTVDALFGREGGEVPDIQQILARWLHSLPVEQRMERCCQALWTSIFDFSPYYPLEVVQGLSYLERAETGGSLMRTRLETEQGFLLGIGAKDFSYMSIFPEPAEGYARFFAENDAYRQLFAALAMPNALELLLILYAEKEHWLTAAAIAKRLGTETAAIQALLDALVNVHALHCKELEDENGFLNAYMVWDKGELVPLLYAARSFMEKELYYTSWRDRIAPILRSTEEK